MIFSFYQDDRIDKSATPQRLLVLNYEDFVKIERMSQNPPSETKVVASNLRFTCWNYYDYLQFINRVTKAQSDEDESMLKRAATNGNIVTIYDIANLYTKELGIKTVPRNDKGNLIDRFAKQILQQYYQQEGSFVNWIKETTVWTIVDAPYFLGINQSNSGSTIFQNFQLDFTAEGNTLTYIPSK